MFADATLGQIPWTQSLRLETDSSKVEAVMSWPVATSVKQVRSFLGLAGYYRRFIKGYAEI